MFWSDGFGIVPNTIGSHYTSMLLDAQIWDTCDLLNILQNGELTSLVSIVTFILDMICVQGGVQVLDHTIYNPPSNSNITFIMHMIFYRGLGHIINMPMYMLRKGAMYNPILMNIAIQPLVFI